MEDYQGALWCFYGTEIEEGDTIILIMDDLDTEEMDDDEIITITVLEGVK